MLALALPAAGCGKGTKKPQPSPSPTPLVATQVTIGLPGLGQPVSGKPSGDMRQYFIQHFGIEFVPWQPPQSDWEASIAAAAASKSLPDMFSQGIYENRMLFKQLIDQKLIREIPESIYKNYVDLGTTMYRYARTEGVDGKMYFLPRSDMARQYGNGNSVAIYYRLDWALDSGAITAGQAPTWKQFMDLMDAFHGDPDKNGSVDTWALTVAGPGLGGLKTAFFMTFGVRDWVLENGKWMPGLLSQRAEEAAKWANQAYRTSCLDPSFSTQSEEEAVNKFCSGKAGMLVYDASPAGVSRIAAAFQLNQPGVDFSKAVSVLPQPVDPWGVSYNEDLSYSTGTLFSNSVDEGSLKKILALMDWLYSDAGLTYASWGEEGKDYNVTGNGLQTLHKSDNLPVTFGELNAEWAPMATLSTWGRDFISDPLLEDYGLKPLGILQETWWMNNWRRPMFTRYIFDQSLQDFDRDGRAEAALAEMIATSSSIEESWPEYVTKMTQELNVEAVSKVVNEYAQAHGITAEE
jgi:hypothetical protein